MRKRRNGYLWTSGEISDSTIRFAVRISVSSEKIGEFGTFSVDLCIDYANSPPYFYFRFLWSTEVENLLHAAPLAVMIPTKFKLGTTIRRLVIAFLLPICCVILWPWLLTFWPLSVDVDGESFGLPSIKFEDPMLRHSWVMTHDVSHRNALGATSHALYQVNRGQK